MGINSRLYCMTGWKIPFETDYNYDPKYPEEFEGSEEMRKKWEAFYAQDNKLGDVTDDMGGDYIMVGIIHHVSEDGRYEPISTHLSMDAHDIAIASESLERYRAVAALDVPGMGEPKLWMFMHYS